jgi:peptide-methionine (S)-S-oxide reductase
MLRSVFPATIILLFVFGCIAGANTKTEMIQQNDTTMNAIDSVVFGSGCFWCSEAVFSQLKGVVSATPGYMGGRLKNPSYEQVCSGATGHAEVVKIEFDSTLISFEELLYVFFATHDPTTLNRQGADVGTQYRSVVFYISAIQKKETEDFISKLNTEKKYSDAVVTEVSSAVDFYPAEEYHMDYYKRNPNASYCRFVIDPKIEKLKKLYSDKLK